MKTNSSILIALLTGALATSAAMKKEWQIEFGYGLGYPANPASGKAFIRMLDGLTIVGDPEEGLAWEGSVYVFTNDYTGYLVLSQILKDQSGYPGGGWFGYCAVHAETYGKKLVIIGSTHSSEPIYDGEGDAQVFLLDDQTKQLSFVQLLHDTNIVMSLTEFSSTMAADKEWLFIGGPWHFYGGTNRTGGLWIYRFDGELYIKWQFVIIEWTVNGNFSVTTAIDGTNAVINAGNTSSYPTGGYGHNFWLTLDPDTQLWGFRGYVRHNNWPIGGEYFGSDSICLKGTNLVMMAPCRALSYAMGRYYYFHLDDSGWKHVASYYPTNVELRGLWGRFSTMEYVPGTDSNKLKLLVSGRNEDSDGSWWWNMPAKGKMWDFELEGTNITLLEVLAPADREMGDWFGSDGATDGVNVWSLSAGAYRNGYKTMIMTKFSPTDLVITNMAAIPSPVSEALPQGGILLEWLDLDGHAYNYTVESTTDLSEQDWAPVPGALWPVMTNRIVVSLPAGDSLFFRIKAE